MSSSSKRGGGSVSVKDEAKVRRLTLGGITEVRGATRVNLRDFGYVGHVSTEAREEIIRNEMRASRVVTTATRFAFR